MTKRRIPVLVNMASGGARDDLPGRVVNAFASFGAEAEVLAIPAAGVEAAVGAIAARSKLVVVGGGDGTIGAAVQRLSAPGAATLGILPLGTRNHFAGDLGIPLGLEEAAAMVVSASARVVDVAEVNGFRFINTASIGLYPLLVRRRTARRRAGWPKWLADARAAWEALARVRHHRLRLTVGSDAQRLVTPLLMVGNNRYEIGGAALGRRERLDAGELSIHAVADRGRMALLWLALRALLGRLHPERDFIALGGCEALTVDSDSNTIEVAIDGETQLLRPPLCFRIRKQALRVIAPEDPAAHQKAQLP